MASLTIIPYKPQVDTYVGDHRFPARHALKIDDQKAPRIEPGIPLIDVPQPLSIAAGGFPKHEKSTTSDGDHLPPKRRGSRSSTDANCSQSLDNGALVSMGEFEAIGEGKHGTPNPTQKHGIPRRGGTCLMIYREQGQ
jgi:hypothetical protein